MSKELYEYSSMNLVGPPAEIHRLKDALKQAPSDFILPTFWRGYPHFNFITSNIAEPGYIYMMQGNKVIAKIDMGGSKIFLDKWNQDGEELKALIERLEQWNK